MFASFAKEKKHSALEHVVRSIYLNRYTGKELMAMFSVYFDASGHSDSTSVLYVSGFVSTVEKWNKFDDCWSELLARHGIKGFFHMKDFTSGVGQYSSWKDDKLKRKQFLAEAIKIIKVYTHKSFSAGVIVEDLKTVSRLYKIPKYASLPYPLCASYAIGNVVQWMHKSLRKRKASGNDTIQYFFEDGDKHKGELIKAFEIRGHRPFPVFLSKEDCSPFQAADLLAWEHRRRISRGIEDDVWKERESLVAITRQLPGGDDWTIADEKAMVTGCNKLGFPRR